MKKLLLLLFLPFGLLAQSSNTKQLNALNNYANFINESIHGMLIAHRLLENYNQEINKYVDLEGYQINNFSNKDLPADIFEDKERWFYEVSPNSWYKIARNASNDLPANEAKKLNEYLTILKSDIVGINRIRFTIPDYIQQNDLQQQEAIEGVYELLEEAVDLYDHFFEIQKKMEVVLIENARRVATPNVKIIDVVEAMDKVWLNSKNVLRDVRAKKTESIPDQVNKLANSIQLLKNIDIHNHTYLKMNSTKTVQSWEIIQNKSQGIVDKATALIETADVPQEYKLYGKFYYYHNVLLATELNRYGFGSAHEMNKIIREVDIPILYRIEEPHFYQVIYPKKLLDDSVIASSDDQILVAPKKLKDRNIVTSTRTIQVDTNVVEIRIYDNKIQDGDIVSINFNGDWILEKYSLEGAPRKLKLKLNDTGKNFLLLHAENEGKRPPNTMAIEYMYQGEKQKITLSSNLSESELIEIQYKAP